MNPSLIFLRPYYFLALVALFGAFYFWRSAPNAWAQICDAQLLKPQLQKKQRTLAKLSIFISGVFIIISLAGPAWEKLPLSYKKPLTPRVIVLDLNNVKYLKLAKFKIRELLQNSGQWGFVVYSGAPFIVSPLTSDSATITALLPSIVPDIMPVPGNDLSQALKKAQQLLKFGDILVITATSPDSGAIKMAKKLAKKNIYVSVMPLQENLILNKFASHGYIVEGNYKLWLDNTKKKFSQIFTKNMQQFKDEGRWFLIPALLFFIPAFRLRK